MGINSTEETEMQKVYVKDGITYLPHYTKRGFFVAPGHTKDAPESVARPRWLRQGPR